MPLHNAIPNQRRRCSVPAGARLKRHYTMSAAVGDGHTVDTMKVMGFDIGLRNMAAALVSVSASYAIPTECTAYASATETPDEFRARAFTHFLLHGGWCLQQWRRIDVLQYLPEPPASVDDASSEELAKAVTRALEALENDWFTIDCGGGTERAAAPAPNIIPVETQHNINATMRCVAFGVMVFFSRSMPGAVIVDTHANGKLAVCDALGIHRGAGLAAIAARAAARSAARESRLAEKAARAADKAARAAAKASAKAGKQSKRAATSMTFASQACVSAARSSCDVIDISNDCDDDDNDDETGFTVTAAQLHARVTPEARSTIAGDVKAPAVQDHARHGDDVRDCGRGGRGRGKGRVRGWWSGGKQGLWARKKQSSTSGTEPLGSHGQLSSTSASTGHADTGVDKGTQGADAPGKHSWYIDNKERALLAVAQLIPPSHPFYDMTKLRGQTHDLADALLMSIYVAWLHSGLIPKVKRRPRVIKAMSKSDATVGGTANHERKRATTTRKRARGGASVCVDTGLATENYSDVDVHDAAAQHSGRDDGCDDRSSRGHAADKGGVAPQSSRVMLV
jgi:hypothetical protein